MRTERDIKSQVSALRDRVKELSGFWIGEGAAMMYALEWALGKRQTSPAGELGRAGGETERIAANLTRLAEKAASEKERKPDPPRRAPGLQKKSRKRPG